MPNELQNAVFGIEIDFQKGSENPSRIFRALTELMEAFETLDNALISSIDSSIKPVAIIEDIETGSIKTWLAYVIRNIEDVAIKDLDWKKIIGSYLVKGKYIVLNFLEDKTSITNRQELEGLENELLELAKETDILQMPSYHKVTPKQLLPGIQQITNALSNLTPQDKVTYKTEREDVIINAEFKMIPESVEELLINRSIKNTNEAILKVKKPDYLGASQWDFRHGTHPVLAKIADLEWLSKYQRREYDIRPGDSLRVILETIVNYGYDNEVVGENYAVIKVLEILPLQNSEQNSIFE